MGCKSTKCKCGKAVKSCSMIKGMCSKCYKALQEQGNKPKPLYP